MELSYPEFVSEMERLEELAVERGEWLADLERKRWYRSLQVTFLRDQVVVEFDSSGCSCCQDTSWVRFPPELLESPRVDLQAWAVGRAWSEALDEDARRTAERERVRLETEERERAELRRLREKFGP